MTESGTTTSVAPCSSGRSISQTKKTLHASRSEPSAAYGAWCARWEYERTEPRCGQEMPFGSPVVPLE